ncbi:sperm acrosome-associated protein 9 [Protopterus annectens]|uniref:sperm acrosome-associated protein 9 n=1 Tax=Protopterus annectens TaxID=7888 RepID=UPI001CFC2673|nr:sperm acrosome-associated protein 9 [Protopterus annectens]XP_043913818.1 sperm acrosome-associated protein 9 [Protopterus annectens]
MMNEVRESLRTLEQRYGLFKQQQVTFVTALERTRENARDRARVVSNLGQVQTYLERHCNNATDRRILTMYLDLCRDLSLLCQKLESLKPEASQTDNALETCKTLLMHNSDISNLRARYPHGEVNRLSCDDAKNHYGGVVSLIPVVLDHIEESIAITEQYQQFISKALKRSSPEYTNKMDQNTLNITSASEEQPGTYGVGTQTKTTRAVGQDKNVSDAYSSANQRSSWDVAKPAWRPPGRTNKM